MKVPIRVSISGVWGGVAGPVASCFSTPSFPKPAKADTLVQSRSLLKGLSTCSVEAALMEEILLASSPSRPFRVSVS